MNSLAQIGELARRLRSKEILAHLFSLKLREYW